MPVANIIGLAQPVLVSKSSRTDEYGIKYSSFSVIGKGGEIDSLLNRQKIGTKPSGLPDVSDSGIIYSLDLRSLQGGVSQLDCSTANIFTATAREQKYFLVNEDSYVLINYRHEITYSSASQQPPASDAPTNILDIPVPGPTATQIKAFNEKERADKIQDGAKRFGTATQNVSFFYKYRIYKGFRLVSFTSKPIAVGVYINTAIYGDVWEVEGDYHDIFPAPSAPV